MKKCRAIGLMSGTSLDGLDIALCEFERKDESWKSTIVKAETHPYNDEWKHKLLEAHTINGYDLTKLDIEYGHLLGSIVKKFCNSHKNKIDFVSSHGHTVFHNPKDGVTLQIGNGAAIAASSGISTISNFRILDVMLQGQGAPLVPIGDMMLFGEYDYCLNLGGFANISYNWYKKRIAFDICPVNIVKNKLSGELGLEFDKNGIEASKGIVQQNLLKALNKIDYYQLNAPKSLGREWVENSFFPVLNSFDFSVNDKLRTVSEHIAFQISKSITGSSSKSVLITGGGTHNLFLIDLLQKKINAKIVIPDKQTVDFKEALVFAFLGLMRVREEKNCLASVTGSKHDNLGGIIYKI